VVTAHRCVIVTGFPRSGTSWLAKGLSFAPGFTYYREPDNHDRVDQAEERFAWLYLTPDQDDAGYHDLMTRACTGRIATAFTMRDDPGPLLRPFGRPGRWLGWEPKPDRLLENPRLVADHLQPFEPLIRRAKGFWERAGALWGATVYVIHRQTTAESPRDIVAYEWLCGDPRARFQELYRRLDMEWTAPAERFTARANGEGDAWAYSLTRVAAKQVDGWRPRLTQGEIDACRRFVEPFELPYYPDFEPEVGSVRGDLSAR
jgi:hypothetical protein